MAGECCSHLLELSTDVVLYILPLLKLQDFLSLTRTCKTLARFKSEAVYWRHLTISTFRFPNQPLLNEHGDRWKQLFQRLNTETRAYTWGKSYSHDSSEIPQRSGVYIGKNAVWPTQMYGVPDSPIVSLQCGGWHTSLLTSTGELYAAGKLPGSLPSAYRRSSSLKQLIYPITLETTPQIYQYSSGREHILGLSDDGQVWYWNNINAEAYKIDFDIFVTPFLRQTAAHGQDIRSWSSASVTSVVAGWCNSSAFIQTEGIVVWKPTEIQSTPKLLVVETMQIPRTNYKRPKGKARESSIESRELGETFGEVVKWVVLELYIVILTDLGKVFAVDISEFHGRGIGQNPIELFGFDPSHGKGKMIDLQGSYHNFAVFNSDGDVILADQKLLDLQCKRQSPTDLLEHTKASPSEEGPHQPRRPPALQNRSVIALAFGDYHLHALTAQGHVLSFGHEPQACGCLGLGGHYDGAFLRGVVLATGHGQDNVINSEVSEDGLRVWFSPEQREWLLEMRRDSMKNTLEPIPSGKEQARLSRYFEKKGADWDLHPSIDNGVWEPWGQGQPAYFTLAITAAGWHSAAIVLVNEARTEKLYRAHKGFLPSNPDPSIDLSRQRRPMIEPLAQQYQRISPSAPTSPWQVISNAGRRLNQMIFGGQYSSEDEVEARVPCNVLAAADQAVRVPHDWYHDSLWSGDEHLPEAARHGVTVPRVSADGEDISEA